MLEQVLTSPLVPAGGEADRDSGSAARWSRSTSGTAGSGRAARTPRRSSTSIVAKRYPDARGVPEGHSRTCSCGWASRRSAPQYLADAHRGRSGARLGPRHAAPMRRGDKPHLRTRVEKDGMNYKGYNIAVHEMGHNVEQTFSLNDVDHTLLQGVPNTAFTEALAFVFQAHDLELLGLATPDAESRARCGRSTISGPPTRSPASRWSTWPCGTGCTSTPTRRPRSCARRRCRSRRTPGTATTRRSSASGTSSLLGIYSHMIDYVLYLPDYPIGHLIAFQIEEQMKKTGSIGPEFERMAKMGRVTPDLWMENATGKPVSADALLAAAAEALKQARQ